MVNILTNESEICANCFCMDIMDKECDDLRFIETFNTQVRSLPICFQIITAIGNMMVPNDIIKRKMINWSKEYEQKSIYYRNSNGKLTNHDKLTTAYDHYISLLISLGLINKQHSIIKNSRYTKVLLALSSHDNFSFFPLSDIQKIFILFILMSKDADGLIVILDFIDQNQKSTQRDTIDEFKNIFLKRLETKRANSHGMIKSKISEKYLRISTYWKNPNKYAEHLIPPRLEWLEQLNLIQKAKSNIVQNYSISNAGKNLLEHLIIYDDTGIHDLNKFTFEHNFSSSIKSLLSNSEELIPWKNQFEVFGNSLSRLFMNFGLDEANRIPLNVAILFLLIDIIINGKILIEIWQIKKILKEDMIFNEIRYITKITSRETESYITFNYSK